VTISIKDAISSVIATSCQFASRHANNGHWICATRRHYPYVGAA
jgi:hypothetical protein